MKLSELIDGVRLRMDDRREPHFLDAADIIGWLNEAQAEAAIRARLLHETQDPKVCRITVEASKSFYALHPSLFELSNVRFAYDGDPRATTVRLKSSEWLDAACEDWRDMTGRPAFAVQEEQGLRLASIPERDGVLLLEGYRTPLADLAGDDDEPEIHPASHRHLIAWALHRAYLVPDTEYFDPARAAQAEDEFARYFGLRPDAGLRRATRADEVQHVEAFMP